MIKQHEVSARNVETAIENGLLELGLQREDVDIKIVDAGGMFKKAKVILEYEAKDEIIKPEVKPIEKTTEIKEVKTEKPKKDKVIVDSDAKNKKSPVIKEYKAVEVKENKNLEQKIINFLNNLFEKLSITASVQCSYTEFGMLFNVTGNDVGKLIGYRGENLNSIQHLINSLKDREDGRVKILFDVENYKEKREAILINLGTKMADKAIKTGRNVHLEPMNAYERRIIHTALQEIADITTESFGEGTSRHIVIKNKP